MDPIWIAAGGGGLVLVAGVAVIRRRRSADVRQSKRAHDAAQDRAPPVDIGETCEFGITEFTEHHSGDRVAVGKVEGFVVFTEGVPSSLSAGDVIRVRITSFNRGHTSADAQFVEGV